MTTFEPLEILINCEVVPYTRMTQRGKWVKPDAIRYMNSQKEVKAIMSEAVHNSDYYQNWYVPEKTPFAVTVTIHIKRLHYCDLDNQLKSLMDAGSKVLYYDDRWCDKIAIDRVAFDGDTWTTMRIEPMNEVTNE